ncbi:MAG: UDP-N-acetylglucosamine 2-epimerase [Patescibacteria group bacterium]|jgi:UDP-hydrolysing UDP-N-acetyl-D-glucosamine 2-epimerase
MKHKNKKIAYISGNRADFGLMTSVLLSIKKSSLLSLDIYATGMHLMPEFGSTIKEVRKLFPETRRVNAKFKTDDAAGMAVFSAQYIKELVQTFTRNRPDFVLTLGDRIEMLSTALVCLYMHIPQGQIHGGEKTSTVDDIARHTITKLSNLHFPATRTSAKRIEKMGEEPWRIHTVGAPALDNILHGDLPNAKETHRFISLAPKHPFILLTQHPISQAWKNSTKHIQHTLRAVKHFRMPVVVTYPNADAGGKMIIKEIKKEKNNPLFRIYPSIPYNYFLALEKYAAVWVGNSSGAMIESSSFHTPVVNVGDRQKGRERGQNVIDVPNNFKLIQMAITKSLYDKKYLQKLQTIKNPWGDGKTGARITQILERTDFNSKLFNKELTYA